MSSSGPFCLRAACAGPLTTSSSAVLASFLLNEELGHLGRVGCTLCLLGSLIIVLHAPEDKEVKTVDEILHYAMQPGASLVSVLHGGPERRPKAS